MEQHTNINFNQLIQDTRLSPGDEQLVNRWLKTHRKMIWIWACCLLPLLLWIVIGYCISLKIKWISVTSGIFMPLELFFFWKLVSTLLKKAKIKSALRKGIKKVASGPLQNLEAGRNFLLYTINNHTIKVLVPKVIAIDSNGFLKQTHITLEVLPLSTKDNTILAVCYPDIPLPGTFTALVSSTEKEPYKTRWSKKVVKILLCSFFVPWGVVLIASDRAREPIIMLIMLLFIISIFVFLAILNGVSNRSIEKCNQKISVTGTITEVILSDIDEEGSTRTKIYGYRVGNELFFIGTEYNSFTLKDKVCFSYLVNKNGEQEMIIDAVKID